jgi:hypothetical protein
VARPDPGPANPPPRPVKLLLGAALTTYREGALAIVVFTALVLVPLQALTIAIGDAGGAAVSRGAFMSLFGIQFVWLAVVAATLTRLPGTGAAHAASVRDLLVGPPWRAILRAFAPLLGLSALAAAPAAAIFAAVELNAGTGWVGLAASQVEAVAQFAILAVAGSAPLLAARGEEDPLRRAIALGRGERLRTVGVLYLATLLVVVAIILIAVPIAAMGLRALVPVIELAVFPYLACVLYVLESDRVAAVAGPGPRPARAYVPAAR